MAKSVIAIRAHKQTPAVSRLLADLLCQFPADDVVLVAERLGERGAATWPDGVRVIALDDGLLRALGLRTDIGDAGWRCGDYAFYALARAAGIDFDFAWLVEPDVEVVGGSVGEAIRSFDASDADLIAADVEPAAGWPWAPHLTSRGVEHPWRSFFPVTRMSRAAVEASLALRLRVQSRDGGEFAAPNDESIVATAAAERGLDHLDLRAAHPEMFRYFRHRPRLVRSAVAGADHPQLVHPCLDPEEYVECVRRGLLRGIKSDLTARLHGADSALVLEHLGECALLTPAERERHLRAFGPRDEQGEQYDDELRMRVTRALPAGVRLLVLASHVVVRALYARPRVRTTGPASPLTGSAQ